MKRIKTAINYSNSDTNKTKLREIKKSLTLGRFLKPLLTVVPLTTLFFASSSYAVSFLSFDPRSMALGGAGVANSSPQNASLFNPALLVSPHFKKPKLFFSVPYAGARLLDRDGFLSAIDNYQNNDSQVVFNNKLALAKSKYQSGALDSADIREVADAAREWRTDLQSLSDKPLRVAASYHFSGGVSGPEYGWGGHFRRYYIVGAQVNFAQQDDEQIGQAIDILDLLADISDNVKDIEAISDALNLPQLAELIDSSIDAGKVLPELESFYDLPTVYDLVEASLTSGKLASDLSDYFDLAGLSEALRQTGAIDNPPKLNQYFTYRPNKNLQSDISVQGAFISETSIGYGTKLDILPQLQLGINLKELNITAIDFRSSIRDISGGDLNEKSNHTEFKRLNVDLGLSYLFNNATRLGFVIKNVVPHDFSTAQNNVIRYRPLARIGISHQMSFTTLVADLDLTTNDPIGFDPDKQYLSVGLETDIYDIVSIRAGARHNIVTGKSLPSFGFGLKLAGIEFDTAFARSDANDEVGMAIQVGLVF